MQLTLRMPRVLYPYIFSKHYMTKQAMKKNNYKITIYSTRICPYCANAKMLLENHGLNYEEIFVNDSATLDAMIIKSNGRRTVPQIFINDRHIGGFDDLQIFAESGGLKNLT